VRGQLRLNLRSAAGTEYRIIGTLQTGDKVNLLKKGDGWVKIAIENGDQGWIPDGYLDSTPPPEIRLEQAEDLVASLSARAETGDATIAALSAENEQLTARDTSQRADIERLSTETSELRGNRRWPEWITGASVLATGMVLGAILHRNATRRPQARIRL
jgi:SH3 domain protein